MSLFRKSRVRFLISAVLLIPPALMAQEPTATNTMDGAIAFARVWADGIEHIQGGRFEQADTLLQTVVSHSSDPAKAQEWLQEWMEAEKARQELTHEDYESYVGRARKWHGKGDHDKSLKWAYLAMLNTADEEAFHKLDWVQEIRRDAKAEADGLRDRHEWRDAHELYYDLNLIFEHDEEIDKLRRECLEHARLDEIYKVDRDWAESLEGITSKMVEDALWRIDQKHVEEVDFGKLTIAGFEELLLIAESPTLQEQLDGLKGGRGEEFVARIGENLRQIREQESIDRRTATRCFRRALEINSQTAQIPEGLLVREYMNAALDQLDEFSSMIWPHEFREFEKQTQGNFIGVGIQIRNRYDPDLKDTEILVVSPLEDTPAYRAGIQAEDIITKVNGQSLLGVPVTKAVGMITGPQGTTVTLTIRRTLESGEKVDIDFPLKRDTIEIQSVKSLTRRTDDEQLWDFLRDPELGIGYVRVNSFQENTVKQLRIALTEAMAGGMRGLILDLRFNPGGLLKSAVQMAELFLARGERIVSTKGLNSREWWVDAEQEGQFKDLPLIILINESSASASEIVSGAIQDHGRGLIVGSRSFGKFSVQNLIQLVQSEAHLKLTTARYYLPSGRCLHHDDGAAEWGVKPDVSVPLVPKEQRKVIYMRLDADVIGAVKTSSEKEMDEPVQPEEKADDAQPGEAQEDEAEEPDVNDRPDRDPQLETAILVMRMHLLRDDGPRIADISTPAANEQRTNK